MDWYDLGYVTGAFGVVVAWVLFYRQVARRGLPPPDIPAPAPRQLSEGEIQRRRAIRAAIARQSGMRIDPHAMMIYDEQNPSNRINFETIDDFDIRDCNSQSMDLFQHGRVHYSRIADRVFITLQDAENGFALFNAREHAITAFGAAFERGPFWDTPLPSPAPVPAPSPDRDYVGFQAEVSRGEGSSILDVPAGQLSPFLEAWGNAVIRIRPRAADGSVGAWTPDPAHLAVPGPAPREDVTQGRARNSLSLHFTREEAERAALVVQDAVSRTVTTGRIPGDPPPRPTPLPRPGTTAPNTLTRRPRALNDD